MTYDQRLWVGCMKLFYQFPQTAPLCLGTRVGRLAPDVQPTLVADAYRVGVVVQAVCADHPFRSAGLNLSITTDNVVVANAEVEASSPVPRIDLSGR